MQHHDFVNFSELWATTNDVSANGKVLSPSAMSIVFDDLTDYPLDWVKKALSIHRKQNKFAPTVADIVEIITSKQPKHPSADEAWVKVLMAMDERVTVVLTTVMQAARSETMAAWDVKNTNPMRMAFRSVYERLVSFQPPIVWEVSLGHDASGRASVINAAVDQGLLPEHKHLELPTPVVVQKLLNGIRLATENGKIVNPSEKSKQMLDQLKNNTFLKTTKTENDQVSDGIAQREADCLAFEQKRAEQLAAIQAKAAS
ncbi:hypothetical protein [Crenothrix polyspora]|uniref:Uncharacterized protein n=1 Tax=Crenothrix polyspora TaxID=360316 RepID=A0A1R4H1A4_9GAMM|nr:hypothetical protein [Crenothrix polyspora]SJM89995.1 conserved hypothetical protein [Crenothrix polyspora]